MVMPAFDVLTKICNTVQLISMGYGNANPGIVEVRLKVDPLRPPYDGAKDYFYISDVDDRDYLVALIKATLPALPRSKSKKSPMK